MIGFAWPVIAYIWDCVYEFLKKEDTILDLHKLILMLFDHSEKLRIMFQTVDKYNG